MKITKEMIELFGEKLDTETLFMMDNEPEKVYLRLLLYKDAISDYVNYNNLISKFKTWEKLLASAKFAYYVQQKLPLDEAMCVLDEYLATPVRGKSRRRKHETVKVEPDQDLAKLLEDNGY